MKFKFITLAVVILCLVGCEQKAEELTPQEAKEIAEEAYIFAYPMLDHYKMMFAMAMYPESGAYTAPFNVLYHNPELSGPQDTIIVRPNNDTFYSAVWFDLSSQPQILKVPKITDNRYYSFQIIDMYTHNIDYIGTRKTGFDSGVYMFVGPNWNGETPDDITKVIKSEGNYLIALARTQVFGLADIENTKDVLNKYSVESLNAYNGLVEAAVINENPEIPPYNPAKIKDVNFISYLNAIMAQGKIHESDKPLFDKFAKIGIVPGQQFEPSLLDTAMVNAINEGVESAMVKIKDEATKLGERKNGWQLISGAFGTREAMQGKNLTRAAAAYFGLWGNDLEEAFYPETTFDLDGEVLDGSKHNYILHFEADELPPVKAFWSISMYKLPEQLFMENEINRYVISSVTEGLEYNDDGSLDIYIQKENPGEDIASNWLPANNGAFSLQARLYWPKPEYLDPLYAMPTIQKND
jgi:hypothetical protein